MLRWACLFLGLVSLGRTVVEAGEPEEKPRIRAVRVETPPKVDGILDEPAWQTAPAATKLYQYEPRAGEELSEKTSFRFLYDDHHLYLGVWCFDRDPDGIIARSMTRDFSVSSDDYIYFLLDTFHDQRNGYVFSVNPNAARYDSLVSRGRTATRIGMGCGRRRPRSTTRGGRRRSRSRFPA